MEWIHSDSLRRGGGSHEVAESVQKHSHHFLSVLPFCFCKSRRGHLNLGAQECFRPNERWENTETWRDLEVLTQHSTAEVI